MACRSIVCACSKLRLVLINRLYDLIQISLFKSWDAYFRNNSYSAPPSLAPPPKHHVPMSQYTGGALAPVGYSGAALTSGHVDDKLIDDHLAVQAIIRSYQVRESVKMLRGRVNEIYNFLSKYFESTNRLI